MVDGSREAEDGRREAEGGKRKAGSGRRKEKDVEIRLILLPVE
jgi:hypothetical protein